jgi:hypothetical protein
VAVPHQVRELALHLGSGRSVRVSPARLSLSPPSCCQVGFVRTDRHHPAVLRRRAQRCQRTCSARGAERGHTPRARAAAGKGPIGFLDPLLYNGVGASDYTDIVPQHYGSAPATFAGADVGVSGPVNKSVGDLEDNQLWEVPVAGYPTTSG